REALNEVLPIVFGMFRILHGAMIGDFAARLGRAVVILDLPLVEVGRRGIAPKPELDGPVDLDDAKLVEYEGAETAVARLDFADDVEVSLRQHRDALVE